VRRDIEWSSTDRTGRIARLTTPGLAAAAHVEIAGRGE
jgi:hypothetical protein